jgi:hypothetical protein
MSGRRIVLVMASAALVALVIGQSWINGHTVDLVVVNASGLPVEISWQPAPGATTESQLDEGCASHSLPLSRGASWQVARDGDVILDSSGASLPLFPALVAVEVWLYPDGSVRIVPPHEVGRLVDAPYPDCENDSSREPRPGIARLV